MFTTLSRDVTGAGRRRLPRRRSARRPRLEALEDRCTPSSVGPSGYLLTDLGILPGYTSSYASGVNDRGQVIGYSQNNSTGAAHAFLYNRGAMIDLGTLGGPDSFAAAINDRGDVVGQAATTVVLGPYGVVVRHAFLYSHGTMTDLGTLPGGTNSGAAAINDRGQVVGNSDTAALPGAPPGTTGPVHAFLSSGGTMKDLGTLAGVGQSYATGINNRGQVVGGSSPAAGGADHAFLYSHGMMKDLGTLGGAGSYASGVNDLGQVVGYSQIDSTGAAHAFLYDHGTMKDLGTLFGTSEPPPSGTGVFSFATAINDRGQVVGWSRTAAGPTHAFLYSHGTMTDLNSLIPADSLKGFTVTTASAINERGQIAAIGSDSAGYNHALLLTPSGPCFTATTADVLQA